MVLSSNNFCTKQLQINKNVTMQLIAVNRPMYYIRHGVCRVLLNTRDTTFDKQEFSKCIRRVSLKGVKRYKEKRRAKALSDTLLLQYCIVGKILSYRKSDISSSISLRNVITLTSFEMSFLIFSNIAFYYVKSQQHLKKTMRAKQYYLRKLNQTKSKQKFSYVLFFATYHNEIFDTLIKN